VKNGICPKCATPTVYRRFEGISYGGGGTFVSTRSSGGGKRCDVAHYVCTKCGLFESYIDDAEKLAEVESTWRKVIK
jgi:hypothetical protein